MPWGQVYELVPLYFLLAQGIAYVYSSRPCLIEVTTCILDLLICRLRLKCDGTHAETRFRLSAKRSRGRGGGVSSVDYWQPRCAHQR